jgi:hypothetical protein
MCGWLYRDRVSNGGINSKRRIGEEIEVDEDGRASQATLALLPLQLQLVYFVILVLFLID